MILRIHAGVEHRRNVLSDVLVEVLGTDLVYERVRVPIMNIYVVSVLWLHVTIMPVVHRHIFARSKTVTPWWIGLSKVTVDLPILTDTNCESSKINAPLKFGFDINFNKCFSSRSWRSFKILMFDLFLQ